MTSPRSRGVIVRLPADHHLSAVVAAGLHFVVVDLVTGPFDEVALRRLVVGAHLARLSVIARTDESISEERVRAAGVDNIDKGYEPLVAIDLDEAVAGALADFAQAAGPPTAQTLVLLPGMLGDARVFGDVVACLVEEMGDQLIVHPARLDLDDSIEGMAASVLAVAPRRFALAGHSLGGIVALEVVRQAPERVTQLALLNASPRPASEAQLDAWAALRDRVNRGEFATLIEELAVDNVGAGREQGLVERWIEMARRIGPDGFVRQLAAQATRPDSRPTLSRVDVSTVVVSGDEDEICQPGLQAELVAGIRGAHHVVIPGAGHMSPLDHPRDVAAALAKWLRN